MDVRLGQNQGHSRRKLQQSSHESDAEKFILHHGNARSASSIVLDDPLDYRFYKLLVHYGSSIG